MAANDSRLRQLASEKRSLEQRLFAGPWQTSSASAADFSRWDEVVGELADLETTAYGREVSELMLRDRRLAQVSAVQARYGVAGVVDVVKTRSFLEKVLENGSSASVLKAIKLQNDALLASAKRSIPKAMAEVGVVADALDRELAIKTFGAGVVKKAKALGITFGDAAAAAKNAEDVWRNREPFLDDWFAREGKKLAVRSDGLMSVADDYRKSYGRLKSAGFPTEETRAWVSGLASETAELTDGVPEARRAFSFVGRKARLAADMTEVDVATVTALDEAVGGMDRVAIMRAGEQFRERAARKMTNSMRTATNEAYRERTDQIARQRPWVYGIRRVLSAGHPSPDYCDLVASVDVGLTPGVYPIGKLPEEHETGMCRDEPVVDKKFFDSGGKALTYEVTPEMQKAIEELGADGVIGQVATELGDAAQIADLAAETSMEAVEFSRVAVDSAPGTNAFYSAAKFGKDELAAMTSGDLQSAMSELLSLKSPSKSQLVHVKRLEGEFSRRGLSAGAADAVSTVADVAAAVEEVAAPPSFVAGADASAIDYERTEAMVESLFGRADYAKLEAMTEEDAIHEWIGGYIEDLGSRFAGDATKAQAWLDSLEAGFSGPYGGRGRYSYGKMHSLVRVADQGEYVSAEVERVRKLLDDMLASKSKEFDKLFRGMVLEDPKDAKRWLTVGAEIEQEAMSSWTTKEGYALDYAEGASASATRVILVIDDAEGVKIAHDEVLTRKGMKFRVTRVEEMAGEDAEGMRSVRLHLELIDEATEKIETEAAKVVAESKKEIGKFLSHEHLANVDLYAEWEQTGGPRGEAWVERYVQSIWQKTGVVAQDGSTPLPMLYQSNRMSPGTAGSYLNGKVRLTNELSEALRIGPTHPKFNEALETIIHEGVHYVTEVATKGLIEYGSPLGRKMEEGLVETSAQMVMRMTGKTSVLTAYQYEIVETMNRVIASTSSPEEARALMKKLLSSSFKERQVWWDGASKRMNVRGGYSTGTTPPMTRGLSGDVLSKIGANPKNDVVPVEKMFEYLSSSSSKTKIEKVVAETLDSKLNSLAEKVLGKKEYEEIARLTMQDATEIWQGNGYTGAKEFMRDPDAFMKKIAGLPQAEQLKAIREARVGMMMTDQVNGALRPVNESLYRGMWFRDDVAGSAAKAQSFLQEGNVLTSPSIESWTSDLGSAEDFVGDRNRGVSIVLKMRNGGKAFDMSGLDTDLEDEWLKPSGTKLKVTKVQEVAPRKFVVTVEEVK